MRPVLITVLTFSVTIPMLAAALSSFHRPDLTAQASGCAGDQLFRASDRLCYSLQGE
jgi:hypothetical protein